MRNNHERDGKRFPQFTLRVFLLVVAISGIGLGWLSMKMRQARKQQEAAMVAPSLQEVHINGSHLTGVGIDNLTKLPRLEEVVVWGAGPGDDADVEKLKKALPGVEVKK